jgi:plastocyanin
MIVAFSEVARRVPRFTLAAVLATAGLAGWAGGQARAGVWPLGPVLAGVAGQYGTIKGRLVYSGDDAPAPKVLIEKGKAEKDPTVCGVAVTIYSKALVVDPKTKGVRYAFAYLVRPKGSNPDALKSLLAKTEKVVIDQKNCEFVPYATALHQEQTIEFKSSDAANHNVNLHAFTNSPFNQVMAPQGTIVKKFVAERRPISLTCDIHPWMKAWIMVFDHPFFAVTGEDGSFEVRGVPAGEQKLVVWQESVGYSTPGAASGMPVTVAADQTTDVGAVKLDASKVRK